MKTSLQHHRHSIRLKGYDYSQAGAYFVTMVTFQRECLFGEVLDGEMVLSKFGQVAQQQWEKLPRRFRNIEADTFVVMPNHIHGIIVINDDTRRGTAESAKDLGVESSRRAPTKEQFQKPVPGSIPTIVRSYKSAVSYRINLMRGMRDAPVWQRNYYERVIRNEREMESFWNYIHANPMQWETDEENLSHP
ncbi:MAG: transposase [Chloroflexota bacterium]